MRFFIWNRGQVFFPYRGEAISWANKSRKQPNRLDDVNFLPCFVICFWGTIAILFWSEMWKKKRVIFCPNSLKFCSLLLLVGRFNQNARSGEKKEKGLFQTEQRKILWGQQKTGPLSPLFSRAKETQELYKKHLKLLSCTKFNLVKRKSPMLAFSQKPCRPERQKMSELFHFSPLFLTRWKFNEIWEFPDYPFYSIFCPSRPLCPGLFQGWNPPRLSEFFCRKSGNIKFFHHQWYSAPWGDSRKLMHSSVQRKRIYFQQILIEFFAKNKCGWPPNDALTRPRQSEIAFAEGQKILRNRCRRPPIFFSFFTLRATLFFLSISLNDFYFKAC